MKFRATVLMMTLPLVAMVGATQGGEKVERVYEMRT